MAKSRRSPLGSVIDFEVDLFNANLELWNTLTGGLFASGVDDDALTDRQVSIRATIDDIRQLVRRMSASGLKREFFGLLHELAVNRQRFERAFVVWVDLLEILVQNAEEQFGSTPGRGLLKASQVKASISYILRNQKFETPQISPILRPVIIDVMVGWVIDALVLALNDYGLWVAEEQPKQSLWDRFKHALWSFFSRIATAIFNAFAHFILWLWRVRDSMTALTPALKSALDAVVREGLIRTSDGSIFRHVVGLLEWIGKNRDSAIKTFQIILEAVQVAESFLDMTGPEKKAYARDLVIAVLSELGYRAQQGLVHAIVVAFVDAAIEVAVHLFNKRGVFAH